MSVGPILMMLTSLAFLHFYPITESRRKNTKLQLENKLVLSSCTVNGERFTGLNCRVFHGFQEYRESFSVNISASL